MPCQHTSQMFGGLCLPSTCELTESVNSHVGGLAWRLWPDMIRGENKHACGWGTVTWIRAAIRQSRRAPLTSLPGHVTWPADLLTWLRGACGPGVCQGRTETKSSSFARMFQLPVTYVSLPGETSLNFSFFFGKNNWNVLKWVFHWLTDWQFKSQSVPSHQYTCSSAPVSML